MKVKVFNLNDVVKQFTEGKYHISFDEKSAIITGKEKFIFTDNEAVHSIHDDSLTLRIEKGYQEYKTFYFLTHELSITIKVKDILAECQPCEEVELGQWIRQGKDRIERNYDRLLNSIEEIGLDPKDYSREGISA